MHLQCHRRTDAIWPRERASLSHRVVPLHQRPEARCRTAENLRPRDIREGMRHMSTDTPRVRTSDAERERIAEKLRTAVGEGRLTLEEGDERLATLYTTKYRDELGPLVADLPAAAGDAGRRGRTRTAADEIWTPESEEAARYPGYG